MQEKSYINTFFKKYKKRKKTRKQKQRVSQIVEKSK